MVVLDSPLFVNDCTLVKGLRFLFIDRRCASALDKEPSKEGKDIEKRVVFVLNIPDKALCIFCSWKQTQHRQFQNQNQIEKMVFRAERLTFLYKQIHRLAGVKLALKIVRKKMNHRFR
ncbi:unnamed protein product [Brassica oleracea var. botrytis]